MLPSKRKRKGDSLNEVDQLLIKNFTALSESPEDDEEELFGRQVAIMLRRIAPRQRAYIKLEIQSLLVDAVLPPEAAYMPQSYYQMQ